jgi:hypothetical protein
MLTTVIVKVIMATRVSTLTHQPPNGTELIGNPFPNK